MAWYQVVDGATERIDPAYVIVDGFREELRKFYVVVDGSRELFYPATAINSVSVTEGAVFTDEVLIDDSSAKIISIEEFVQASEAQTLDVIATVLEAAQFLDEVLVDEQSPVEKVVEELIQASEAVGVDKFVDLLETAQFIDEVMIDDVGAVDKLVEEFLQASEGQVLSVDQFVEVSETAQILDEVSIDKDAGTDDKFIEELVQAAEAISLSTATVGPSDLTVRFDPSACGLDLSWTPDEANQQEIWQCDGQGCSPDFHRDTVAAGVSSYTDTGPAEGSGYYNYEIRTSAGTSNVDQASMGTCFD